MIKVKKFFISIVFLLLLVTSNAQLFDNPSNVALTTKSVELIYNMNQDSALFYLRKIEDRLPDHPIVPMLQAVNLLWQSVPYITEEPNFGIFKQYLEEVVVKARAIDDGQQQNTEAIFFEMAARGLLAEYSAEADNYVKAVNEASKAYGLLKKAFDKTDEISDFLFTVGIYNYFREAYPEKYPVYKPFVWVFRHGDKEKGIKQLKEACEQALIVRVEASIYLSYIYLRYEYKPKEAQSFLLKLVKAYPNNPYIRSKYLESMAASKDSFGKIKVSDYQMVFKDARDYYQLSGYTFKGLYEEWNLADLLSAEETYKRALSKGYNLKSRGLYFKSVCYLGLGRISLKNSDFPVAEHYLKLAIETAETKDVKEEAEKLLSLM